MLVQEHCSAQTLGPGKTDAPTEGNETLGFGRSDIDGNSEDLKGRSRTAVRVEQCFCSLGSYMWSDTMLTNCKDNMRGTHILRSFSFSLYKDL